VHAPRQLRCTGAVNGFMGSFNSAAGPLCQRTPNPLVTRKDVPSIILKNFRL